MTNKPERTSVYLTHRLKVKLDKLCEKLGENKNQVIRAALEKEYNRYFVDNEEPL